MAALNEQKGVGNTDTLPQVFNFDAITVRTFNKEGEVWFAAADVCAALDINNPRDATRRLDDDEKGVHTVDTPRGEQEIVIINESGLYSLILTSRKAEAKKFKKWVTSEVLPAIRTEGKYEAAAPAIPAKKAAPALPPPRRFKKRDDLSFTKRDDEGRLLNWFVPSRNGQWHEHYGIGEIWFSEIVELAKHDPQEAFNAMRFASQNLVQFWNWGHEEGFMERMSRWALAAILDHKGVEPSLPFKLPEIGSPPKEGFDYYRNQGKPKLTQEEIDQKAWDDARAYFEKRRKELESGGK